MSLAKHELVPKKEVLDFLVLGFYEETDGKHLNYERIYRKFKKELNEHEFSQSKPFNCLNPPDGDKKLFLSYLGKHERDHKTGRFTELVLDKRMVENLYDFFIQSSDETSSYTTNDIVFARILLEVFFPGYIDENIRTIQRH